MVYRLVLLQRSFVEMNEIFELSKFLYQTSFAIIVMNQFQNSRKKNTAIGCIIIHIIGSSY